MYRVFSFAVLALLAAGCMSTLPDTSSPDADPPMGALSDADWMTTAESLRGDAPMRVQVFCPANPDAENIGVVWGTDTYTDDSSICAAAVHAGAISVGGGGSVTIELRPGQEAYQGSNANGILSLSYGTWGGSFIVLS